MKISIIGPGVMPIPPIGWGAVEGIIHEYITRLQKRGHNVQLVNTRDRTTIVNSVNQFEPDFVYCQYDEFIDVLDKINCKFKAITSHFGYLWKLWEFPDYVEKVHIPICKAKNVYIFALSEEIKNIYIGDGVDPHRIFVLPNGVATEKISFEKLPPHQDRSIYLGKIDYRKRQGTVQKFDETVDFAGNLCPHTAVSSGFNPDLSSYLGEWKREDVFKKLTKYANLVLLSDGEAHALVCMEALAAGLGLVISEYATANLDISHPYITVIPADRLNDPEFVKKSIDENRILSLKYREDIRQYALQFDWELVIEKFISFTNLIKNSVQNQESKAEIVEARVAVLIIAAGQFYDDFFIDLFASIEDKLLKGIKYRIYCFTDLAENSVIKSEKIEYIFIKKLGWPFNTLLRFNIISTVLNKLYSYSSIMFIDCDMIAVDSLPTEILSKKLFAVQHPGYIDNPTFGNFELFSQEPSSVSFKSRSIYVQGCFWGGDFLNIKKMIGTISDMVKNDLEKFKIPVWHDESYLNWYFSKHEHYVVHPRLAYPENWKLPFEPILIHRAKIHNKYREKPFTFNVEDLFSNTKDGNLESNPLFWRSLYLKSHEKNQQLEEIIKGNLYKRRKFLLKIRFFKEKLKLYFKIP